MVARYYRELLRFLQGMVKDRDTAADLAQESYARVLAVERSGEKITEPRALLYRTARNLVIDGHRRTEVRGQNLADADALDAVLDGLQAPVASEPDAAAMSSQAVNALLAAIGELPLRCREAFILHKFDGLSQAEVARQMGISVTMVERHIKLGMQACRACQDRMDGRGDSAIDSSADSTPPRASNAPGKGGK
ncbi:sigma-70 family RNA polymerase sigma factor [Pigmentiphaga aceris]|uniref:Sigma-70 family RNA polymerase sigma factor n=1 Tax=Pigmentiphaga aceris TaxID=1940612 RepID=A0A5C0B7P6_9BURK|nr:sigma-70 family RNA polymerase sigma factor [Pigmentiphaga aceris]QEI09131.1 sigma-70 family RNA polymerase sigma factor [Pigmentiphaga aceris]